MPQRYFIFRKFYKHHAHAVSPTFISLLISKINPWNVHILFQIKLAVNDLHFVIFFPCFLFKFYVIFTKFLKVSGTWKYFIKFSYLVGLNFISIIDRWNYLSLYQYMSWAGGCRTPMTIYKLEKPWFPLPIFVWCCLNCSMCFRDYSFVWVAISRQCFRD